MFASLIRPCALLIALTFLSLTPASAQTPSTSVPATIETPDQPGAIPLRRNRVQSHEQWMNVIGGRMARNVNVATLTPFLPDPANATGAAVIVAPGGAFRTLMMDGEGYDVARWLAAHGIAAFVLKYRTIETPRDTPNYFRVMGQFMSGLSSPTVRAANLVTPNDALEDAQTAVHLVRTRANEWRVDPQRVGFVGFSAGAILAVSVGTASDVADRPNFIAPIYGSLAARSVPTDAPPMFLAIALDDPIMAQHQDKFGLIKAWLDAGRPLEVHLYERGGHGFAVTKSQPASAMWIDEFYAWMNNRGLISAPTTQSRTPG